jgi:hypothetical protein
MSQVITYQSPDGEMIDLTPAQVTWLSGVDRWPEDSHGWPFDTRSGDAHPGFPTYHDDHLRKLVGLQHDRRETPALSQEPFPPDPDDERSGFYDQAVDPALARGIDRNQ